MGIFGWDLPPGCSINDIPGNRPEDIKWEAIEYGIELGRIEEREYQADKLYTDAMFKDYKDGQIRDVLEYMPMWEG